MSDDIEDLEPERIPAPPTAGAGPLSPGTAPPATGGGDAPTTRPLKRHRIGLALGIAIAADAAQWVMFPLFMAGAVSPVDDVLDIAIALLMIRMLGWHWAFLPTFVAELLPGVDLVPSWTLAVWLATRGKPKV